MKRIFKKSIYVVLVLCLMLCSACSGKSDSSDKASISDTASSKVTTTVPADSSSVAESATTQAKEEPKDDGTHLNTIGLYVPNKEKNNRELITTFKSNWIKGKDITCFEAFATREPVIPNTQFITAWKSYWDNFKDSSEYKIGYFMTLTLDTSEQLSVRILTPQDTEIYKPYIETYLYDDFHQTPGVFYSHVIPSQLNKDTICTSIKLTAGVKSEKVKEITLSAFAYQSDKDFDPATKKYIGKLSYEIKVLRNS